MKDRLSEETVEEREARLQQMRDRLSDETVEAREARLQQMRDRLSDETVEAREARLQQMRDRLSDETVEEREARLQQMRTSQRERQSTETADETEARLQHDRESHREQRALGALSQSQLPLIQQHSVQAKMNTRIWLPWRSQDVAHVWKLSLVCTFSLALLSVHAVAETSIPPNCTPVEITWILAHNHMHSFSNALLLTVCNSTPCEGSPHNALHLSSYLSLRNLCL